MTTDPKKSSGKKSGGKDGDPVVRGGPARRPGNRAISVPKQRRMSGALIAWSSVGLVVVIIMALVVAKLASGGSRNTSYTLTTPAPASIISAVTGIPVSVYNTVGVNIPSAASPAPPLVLSNQPALSLGGKTPAMFYFGAEYCPYCAAERWAIVAALSRFGTFTGLKVTASSLTDPAGPDTRTFSFVGSTYKSSYITFFPVEAQTNIPSGNGYTSLQTPTKQEQQLMSTYSTPQYIPGAQPGVLSYPFVDIGNKMLIAGATFTPLLLQNLTHADIAGGLTDPTSAVTQSIVGAANYITAGVCATTSQQPANVCSSKGVQAADKALRLN